MVLIYLVSEHTRSQTFFRNLKKEGITKAHLFLAGQVDAEAMQSIYLNNRKFIDEVKVAIYTRDFDLLYHDAVRNDIIQVTANLSKGALVMSRKKTILKDLNAIQNFGAMNILCTDKTGTLTQDHIVLERHVNINGTEDKENHILRHAYFNSYFQTGLKNLIDRAILSHVQELGLEHLNESYQKVDEIPFDFIRHRMSVVVENVHGKRQIITKGAVEEMLNVCAFAELDGEVRLLSAEMRSKAQELVREMNNQGMRVLALAHKTFLSKDNNFSVEDEKDMVLIGYLAFLDPPKDSASQAIKQLHEHGVEVKVLSGDNEAVVKAISRQVGIDTSTAVSGPELEIMSLDEKRKTVENCHIFSKLTPMQKAEIIRLLQMNQHTVGFLGDGINDVAALRESDIGISVDSAVDIVKYVKMTASSNFATCSVYWQPVPFCLSCRCCPSIF